MRRATMAMAVVMAAGMVIGWTQPAAAQTQPAKPADSGAVSHDGHSHGMAYVEPKTYAEALRLIGSRVALLQSMVDAGKWDETHGDADAIAATGKVLGRLALAKDSGVARPAVKDVNIGGKALAEAATAMHEALNAGNKDEAAKRFGRLKTVFGEVSKAAPAAYSLALEPRGDLKAGAPASLTAALKDPKGAVVQGLEIVHEQPAHFIVASRDLSWYRHEHPKRGADGTFALEVTPPQPGDYVVFADFTPSADTNQVATATFSVPGSPPLVGPRFVIDAAEVKHAAGLDVRVRCNGGYKSREETVIRYNFQESGKDVTEFEPYLGAPAHLVILSSDGMQFVHAHPVEKGAAGADALFAKAASYGNGKDTDLVFATSLPMSGLYRAFLQFKRAGEVHTVPFTIEVLSAEVEHDHDERTEAPKSMGTKGAAKP